MNVVSYGRRQFRFTARNRCAYQPNGTRSLFLGVSVASQRTLSKMALTLSTAWLRSITVGQLGAVASSVVQILSLFSLGLRRVWDSERIIWALAIWSHVGLANCHDSILLFDDP